MSGGDDWKPGDLALCVNRGEIDCPHGIIFCGGGVPPVGSVSTVSKFGTVRSIETDRSQATCGCGCLLFSDGTSGLSLRFRKIHPHTPDEQDEITIRLLNSAPVKEPVA